MTMGYNVTLRNAQLNLTRDAIDNDASPGQILIYDGVRPATGGAATTLLATGTFSATSAPDAALGVLTANAISSESSAPATGTATWCRVQDGAGVHVTDGSVGLVGSGADLELDVVTIAITGIVNFNSFVITQDNP